MTILLTGAAGFIGSHTSRALLNEGHQVIGIDDLNDFYNPAWKEENLQPLKENKEFTFYKQDIRDLEGLLTIARQHRPEVILHLAARAGVRPSIREPLLYEETNVRGTLNLLEIAREQGIRQFVFASSSSVYGNQDKVPFSETDPCNAPISPYAATKKAAELLAYTYSHLYGINCIGLRFFTVYGPAGRPDMAPYLFTEAILTGRPINKFGDGTTRRDYTYIDDIVAGVAASINIDRRFEIINLGNNSPITLNEFISTLENITGNQMQVIEKEMQPGDVVQTYADIEKAKKLLGFEPKTSFAEGMSKFVEWFKQNRL
jgi:UDP-glucuronate 4-epimerase